MTGSFTGGWYPDLSLYPDTALPREDFIAETDAPHYAIAFDTHGNLGWAFPCIDDDDPGYDQAHVIEVLSEEVPDRFLHYLKQTGISYIFAGRDKINVTIAAEKLFRYFAVKTLLLEGGSLINGSFEKAGLIDELSIIQAPLTEPESDKLIFENGFSSAYDLKEIKQLLASLWIRYKR